MRTLVAFGKRLFKAPILSLIFTPPITSLNGFGGLSLNKDKYSISLATLNPTILVSKNFTVP